MSRRSDSNQYYSDLWLSQVVLPDWKDDIERAVARMDACREMYIEVAKKTKIAWGFFACTHWLEASCDPERQILNGQRYDRITTIVPEGKGPFKSWEDAALYGVQWHGLEPSELDTLQELLRHLEAWNGFGYRNIGVNSPYLWSGTQHGVGVGKYVRDHVYDKNAVSGQVGCAPLLKALIEKYEQ